MTKIITSLLIVMALSSAHVSANYDNIWTLDRLQNPKTSSQVAQKNGGQIIDESGINNVKASQTITQTDIKDKIEQPVAGENIYKDNLYTTIKWGATAAGLGITYLYGPAALFWGTYYSSSYLLGKLGIAGITGLSAATKAAIMVADSPTGQTALIAIGGFVAKHGATAAIKVGETVGSVAWAGSKLAAKGAWSLGSYAYNHFWGDTAPAQEEKPKSSPQEQMREAVLRAAEKRIIDRNIEKNLTSSKVRKFFDVVS